ncbi:MAG: hypothetical protein ACUVWP_01585 [bacterium]
MKELIIIGLLFITINAFSVPGDTIRTFKLDGQPYGGVHGLAYDPVDGNIWAASPEGPNLCYFCKFKNDETYTILQKWQKLQT